MVSMGVGLSFILLNTLMLVANATVTTICSYTIMKEAKRNAKKD